MNYKFFLMLVLMGLLFFSQCTEKEALEILGYMPPQPAEVPTISRGNLKAANGSFLPGYQGGKILSDRITLDWQQTNLNEFLSYRIFRNNSIIGTVKDQSAPTFTDSSLSQNSFYNYKVAVLNEQGVAKIDTILLKTPLFSSPSGLTATLSGNDITLNWNNQAEPEISFRIYRSMNFGDFQSIGTSDTTTFTNFSLSSGGYRYYVSAFFNSLEETSPSNTTPIVNVP